MKPKNAETLLGACCRCGRLHGLGRVFGASSPGPDAKRSGPRVLGRRSCHLFLDDLI
jgi:hypothetical protein